MQHCNAISTATSTATAADLGLRVGHGLRASGGMHLDARVAQRDVCAVRAPSSPGCWFNCI